MVLSTIITFALALWLLLWALDVHSFVAFIVAMLIILVGIALHMARGGHDGGSRA